MTKRGGFAEKWCSEGFNPTKWDTFFGTSKANIDGKMKDQEQTKQMALATRRREGLEMQHKMQIGAAREERPKEDERIAEARVTAEEL